MIIGLGHRARSGKDTLADYLVKQHGFIKVSFATPLKEAARDIFLLTDEQMYGDLKEVVDPRWGRTPRDILQKLGTESVRNVFGPNVWINRCFYGLDPKKNYVIADVRFVNEALAVKSWGGYVVQVNRQSLPPIKRGKPSLWDRVKAYVTLKPQPLGAWIGHQSETDLLDFKGWDGLVQNDGTLEDLYRRGEEVLFSFRTRELMKDIEKVLWRNGSV